MAHSRRPLVARPAPSTSNGEALLCSLVRASERGKEAETRSETRQLRRRARDHGATFHALVRRIPPFGDRPPRAPQADLSASTMSIIAKQIKALVKRPLDGVRYVPDHGSLTEVHAIIQGPGEQPHTRHPRQTPSRCHSCVAEPHFARPGCGPRRERKRDCRTRAVCAALAIAERTPYEGGEFRVKLMLGADYPSAPPKGEVQSCADACKRSARGWQRLAAVDCNSAEFATRERAHP